ncbi:hypothetical protein [Streptomyces sp. NPDC059003]|uniref:hypothetical protein n=1 Tax=Streptomyces sp. NPDC059003 TaxID=3346691 RepID=UPI0036D14588
MTAPGEEALPPTCVCPEPWAELVTVIEGRRLAARPAESLGPAAALFRAHCAACGAEYAGPWRLIPGQRRAS